MHARSCSFALVLFVIAGAAAGDAGAQEGWYVQTCPVSADLFGVDFITPTEGWICGGGGVILHTTDGGEHWAVQNSGTTLKLYGISFGSSQVGYAVGGGGELGDMIVLGTTNGGSSWALLMYYQYGFPWKAVHAIDAQHVWIAGSDSGSPSHGMVFWSADGGATWDSHFIECDDPHPPCSSSVVDVFALNPAVFFLAGAIGRYDGSTYGTLWKTMDGGTSFAPVWSDGSGCTGVQFLTSWDGYVVGSDVAPGFIKSTTDGGGHWTRHDPGTSTTRLSFVDRSRGWVAGFNGDIARTTDGGATWTPQSSGTSMQLTDIDFVDSSVGAAVGYGSTILHTVSGGAPSGVDQTTSSAGLRLLPMAPNPSSRDARVAWELPRASAVSLAVFDASGRLVKSLWNGLAPSGRHEVLWNGCDAAGRPVAAGVYFVRLSGAVGSKQQRILLIP